MSLFSQIEGFNTRSLKHVNTHLTTPEGKKVSKMLHACIARVVSPYLHSSLLVCGEARCHWCCESRATGRDRAGVLSGLLPLQDSRHGYRGAASWLPGCGL